MAYIQNGVQGSQRNVYKMINFSGGINNISEYFEENQVADMLNMTYDHDGTLKRRPGYTYVEGFETDKAPIGNDNATFLDYFEPYQGPPIPIASSYSRFVWRDGPNSWNQRNVRLFDGLNYKGMYLFFREDGLFALIKNTTITEGTYVTIKGTKRTEEFTMFKISTPGAYTPLDSSHTKGVTHYDYDALSVEYRPCQNEIADPYKGKNVVPTNLRYAEQLKGRVYATVQDGEDDDTIYVSDTGNAFYFPPGMGLALPSNSDKIIGLYSFDDGVVVFRHYDVHIVRGTTNNPTLNLPLFSIEELNTSTGMFAPRLANRAQTYLFFIGSDGKAYALSSTYKDEKRINTQLLSKTVSLFDAPFNFPKKPAEQDNYSCLFDDDKYYIFHGGKAVVYDFNYMCWYRYEGLPIGHGTRYIDNSLHLISTQGHLFQFDESHANDLGAPFRSYFKTGRIDVGQSFYQKLFRHGHLISQSYNDKVSGKLTYTFDDMAKIEAPLYGYEHAVFDKSNYGESHFAYSNRVVSDRIRLSTRAYRLEIEFEIGSHTVGRYETLAEVQNRLPSYDDGSLFYVVAEKVVYKKEGNDLVKFDVEDGFEPAKIYQFDLEYELRGRK